MRPCPLANLRTHVRDRSIASHEECLVPKRAVISGHTSDNMCQIPTHLQKILYTGLHN
jgi:hypothetical protein